jgi:hypothetical protein
MVVCSWLWDMPVVGPTSSSIDLRMFNYKLTRPRPDHFMPNRVRLKVWDGDFMPRDGASSGFSGCFRAVREG